MKSDESDEMKVQDSFICVEDEEAGMRFAWSQCTNEKGWARKTGANSCTTWATCISHCIQRGVRRAWHGMANHHFCLEYGIT